jgi:hypothetical protein
MSPKTPTSSTTTKTDMTPDKIYFLCGMAIGMALVGFPLLVFLRVGYK